MMDAFLDFMLGPMRGIGKFYFENQAILNTIVVGFALYKMSTRKKRALTMNLRVIKLI